MIKIIKVYIGHDLIKNMEVCEICLDCFKNGETVYIEGDKHYHQLCYLTKDN